MANYEIFISSSAEKTLTKLPKKDVQQITVAIRFLATDPYPANCKKLSGEENVFRIRVGIYRVLYQIENKKLTILVLKIGHRKEVYR